MSCCHVVMTTWQGGFFFNAIISRKRKTSVNIISMNKDKKRPHTHPFKQHIREFTFFIVLKLFHFRDTCYIVLCILLIYFVYLFTWRLWFSCELCLSWSPFCCLMFSPKTNICATASLIKVMLHFLKMLSNCPRTWKRLGPNCVLSTSRVGKCSLRGKTK